MHGFPAGSRARFVRQVASASRRALNRMNGEKDARRVSGEDEGDPAIAEREGVDSLLSDLTASSV